MIKSKVEINFHWKRGSVGGNRKVEIVIPGALIGKLTGQTNNLDLLLPYITSHVNKGEVVDYYTKRVLIPNIDLENKKIEKEQKKEDEKRETEDIKREQTKQKRKLDEELEFSKREVLDKSSSINEDISQLVEKEIKKTRKKPKQKQSDNNTEKQASYLDEKEKIDLDIYKKKKELELNEEIEKKKIEAKFYEKRVIIESKENIKKVKIERAKEDLNNGGSKILYYLRTFWYFLDKPWKKITFFVFLFILSIFVSDFITQSSDRERLIDANARFEKIYIETQDEITNRNYEKALLLLFDLETIINNTHISNEFVIDKKNAIQKDWERKYEKLKGQIESSETGL